MIVLVLAFLFALLGFLASFQGIFALLLGMLLFLALPIVPRATDKFHRFANLHLWLSMSILTRAAIVVSEHGDILLKRMQFDDLGVETMQFGDEEKEFEDPDSALHYWMGIPFALADEVHGVLFDPRHAALGARKQDAKEKNEYAARASDTVWQRDGIYKWIKGVFEMPKQNELVDLGAVRYLVDGGERSEYPARTERYYEYSRDPFKTATRATRFILIVVALLGPFAMMWLLASQGGGGGGGGGSTVSYELGVFALWLIPLNEVLPDGLLDTARRAAARVKAAVTSAGAGIKSAAAGGGSDAKDSFDDVPWKDVGIVLGVVLPLPTLFLLLFVFASPIFAVLFFVTLGMGFWAVPLLAILTRPWNLVSGGLSRLLLKLGLLGYERPVWEWTPAKYRLREYDHLDSTGDVTWYNLSGSLVGFSFDPSPDSWGAEVVEKSELETRSEVATDGGEAVDGNLPTGYTRAPSMSRADMFAAMVPTRIKNSCYYLHTGIATGRFADSAVGDKSLSRLLWSKDKYGGEGGLSDRSIVYAMVGCGLLSFVFGVWVFFL